jgi:hypothetical protein
MRRGTLGTICSQLPKNDISRDFGDGKPASRSDFRRVLLARSAQTEWAGGARVFVEGFTLTGMGCHGQIGPISHDELRNRQPGDIDGRTDSGKSNANGSRRI